MGNFFNKLDEFVDTVDKATSTYKEARDTYETSKQNLQDNINFIKNSKERKAQLALAKKYSKASTIIGYVTFILCLTVLITTIVFCISGNDVILNFLHI